MECKADTINKNNNKNICKNQERITKAFEKFFLAKQFYLSNN